MLGYGDHHWAVRLLPFAWRIVPRWMKPGVAQSFAQIIPYGCASDRPPPERDDRAGRVRARARPRPGRHSQSVLGNAHRSLSERRHTVQPQDRRTARSLTPVAPADGRASAASAVPASLVPPMGLCGHPRALPFRPGSHQDACRSGERPCPGRPCSRGLSPRARRGALGVACIPDDRHGRRPAGLSVGRALASGVVDQLFRDQWGRGADDLARDRCCLVSSMIASPKHGWLGGATVLIRNGGTGAERSRRRVPQGSTGPRQAPCSPGTL